jgi:hypothetical protein
MRSARTAGLERPFETVRGTGRSRRIFEASMNPFMTSSARRSRRSGLAGTWKRVAVDKTTGETGPVTSVSGYANAKFLTTKPAARH